MGLTAQWGCQASDEHTELCRAGSREGTVHRYGHKVRLLHNDAVRVVQSAFHPSVSFSCSTGLVRKAEER